MCLRFLFRSRCRICFPHSLLSIAETQGALNRVRADIDQTNDARKSRESSSMSQGDEELLVVWWTCRLWISVSLFCMANWSIFRAHPCPSVGFGRRARCKALKEVEDCVLLYAPNSGIFMLPSTLTDCRRLSLCLVKKSVCPFQRMKRRAES